MSATGHKGRGLLIVKRGAGQNKEEENVRERETGERCDQRA